MNDIESAVQTAHEIRFAASERPGRLKPSERAELYLLSVDYPNDLTDITADEFVAEHVGVPLPSIRDAKVRIHALV